MINFFTYIFLCFIQIINIHEFYVSATKVDYSKENSSIQCVSRVFLDDLEKSFSFDDYIFSVNKNGKQKFDSLLKKYLNKNFSLILNDEKLKLSFIGTEIDNDLAIIYFEFSTKKKIDSIMIKNSILMDKISTQKNIIHFSYDSFKRSYLLSKKNPYVIVNNFKN